MARIIRSSNAGPGFASLRLAAIACAGVLAIGAWSVLDRVGQPPGGEGAEQASRPAPTPEQLRLEVATPPARESDPPPGASAVPITLERLEMAPSGNAVAVLRVDGGAPARHALGDSLARGIRLARIALEGVSIEREGRMEVLDLPPGVEPLRRDAVHAGTTAVRPLSATLPQPPTRAVAELLDSAPSPGVVTPSPDRANPARGGIDRMVAAEALRLSTP